MSFVVLKIWLFGFGKVWKSFGNFLKEFLQALYKSILQSPYVNKFIF